MTFFQDPIAAFYDSFKYLVVSLGIISTHILNDCKKLESKCAFISPLSTVAFMVLAILQVLTRFKLTFDERKLLSNIGWRFPVGYMKLSTVLRRCWSDSQNDVLCLLCKVILKKTGEMGDEPGSWTQAFPFLFWSSQLGFHHGVSGAHSTQCQ